MKAVAVIPTRYEPERLAALLPAIDIPLIVLDNGHEPPLEDAIDTRGMGIYAQWNLGWRRARDDGFDAIALLNDDIRILPGTLPLMAQALASGPTVGVVYPDWPMPLDAGLPRKLKLEATAGTVSVGGMTGFCFMFRTALPVAPFDEGFGWWFGDDAFEQSVRHRGFTVCRVAGLPCEHDSDSERDGWARRPELRQIADADAVRWAAMSTTP